MKLQTPVADSPCKVGISYKDRILMLGSCFSDNIGKQLSDFGFDVCVNPFGTLYNPESILSAVRRLLSRERFTAEDCEEIGAGDLRTCSFSHHTSHARATREEFLSDANLSLEKAADFFKDCNRIIITLGTSWCYRHIGRDMIVSNCLKHPAREYTREFLTADRTSAILQEIMSICNSSKGIRPKEFIFTVSPIRHFKDGAHGNQISKASLLLGVESAIQATDDSQGTIPGTDYFPAYEIMMDELRDYRFYAEDMCHPSQQAVDYIRERFLNRALPESEHSELRINMAEYRNRSHIRK